MISAHVAITPLVASTGSSRMPKAKALVTLETEDDRPVSNRSVRKVLSLLRGFTRFEIAAESVGLLDARRQYLDAGNLALLRSVLNGAHRKTSRTKSARACRATTPKSAFDLKPTPNRRATAKRIRIHRRSSIGLRTWPTRNRKRLAA